MSTSLAEALPPLTKRIPRPVRDIEVLRMSVYLDGDDFELSTKNARDASLVWASSTRRAGGQLPDEAWDHLDFELLAGGRNSSGVRFQTLDTDLWALRTDVPDETVPGRVWTNEIVVGGEIGKRPHLSLRLIVNTGEAEFNIEPHVPGTILQLVKSPGLLRAGRKLRDAPITLITENDVEDICDYLEDPERKLPVFVVTLLEGEDTIPLIADSDVARATAGLARVVRIPAHLTWVLIKRFGKQRAVFDGGVRAYLPNFSSSDDPYRHRLFIAGSLKDNGRATACCIWLRKLAADLSISTMRLGKDVVEFSSIRTASRRLRASSLTKQQASDTEVLATAHELVESLERQLSEKNREVDDFIAEVEAAEERAQAAEQENRSLLFKIRQLQETLVQDGVNPKLELPLPQRWPEFSDWLDQAYPDRIVLTPTARRMIRNPEFEDVSMVARAITWLANEQHTRRLSGGGSTRDEVIESGIINAYCGGDTYQIYWKNRRYEVDQHVKTSGNTRDPKRCLRIYYFWEPDLQQTVIDHLPSHRVTSAT